MANIYIYIYMYIYWLVVTTPLKKCEFVSWDDKIPNVWKHKIDVPNHQSVYNLYNLHRNQHESTLKWTQKASGGGR